MLTWPIKVGECPVRAITVMKRACSWLDSGRLQMTSWPRTHKQWKVGEPLPGVRSHHGFIVDPPERPRSCSRDRRGGAGSAPKLARPSGTDRKTVRRYVDRARACGPDCDGGDGQLTDELLAAVIAGVRPSRPAGKSLVGDDRC